MGNVIGMRGEGAHFPRGYVLYEFPSLAPDARCGNHERIDVVTLHLLCDRKTSSQQRPQRPEFWCDACAMDLQSSASLAQHRRGRKHAKKEFWQSFEKKKNDAAHAAGATNNSKRPPFSSTQPPLDESELFHGLASKRYRNVVVLTGAGVSTSAGIPDFRSRGGFFDTLRERYGPRFPIVYENPEFVLSRSFAQQYPECAEEIRREVLAPAGKDIMNNVLPTATHEFCAWLHRRGMLRRVYTQNIDGLHLHPSLDMPPDLVVECHGSYHRSTTLILYGDDLPRRFYDCCDADFPLSNKNDCPVDLLMVFGTSLQVAPFCGVPNMAPRGSARVLVNRDVGDCHFNSFSKQQRRGKNGGGMGGVTNCQIGSRKNVPLQSLWSTREGNKKWRQLVIEDDCDSFVWRFFDSDSAKENEIVMDLSEVIRT
eukprot:CAMPEP_0183710650 /NCGR_PEP_ID=MMETSP0737-20130205/6329_1 /TAXON_ID=385413 /ORGANISM="Thalassiosira miniscula, Strain CCMP1093" /LENGTH=424 /DNA_ID=CAMNT_0025938969 /DNA_START=370 /DNA_END=1644 /DNA_ORIENTATION=-